MRLLLSRFSRVRLFATPETAAHPSLWFSRQEHWSGLPFPSPMHLTVTLQTTVMVYNFSCVFMCLTWVKQWKSKIIAIALVYSGILSFQSVLLILNYLRVYHSLLSLQLGRRYLLAPCIQLVLGIANRIGKPVYLETWISGHGTSSHYRATFSAQPELQQKKYDTTWKDCLWLHEQCHWGSWMGR